MSQADIFPSETTILCMPSWYSDKVREELELPLASGDYKVTQDERWSVISLTTTSRVRCLASTNKHLPPSLRWHAQCPTSNL